MTVLAPETDEVLALSTIPMTPNASGNCPDLPAQALDDFVRNASVRDAFLWVARSSSTAAAPPLDDLELPIRPADDARVAECIPITGGFAPPIAFTRGTYERDGQNVDVLVALGLGDTDLTVAKATRDELRTMLEGLRVQPGLLTYRSTDQRLLVEHPPSWDVAEGPSDTVVLGTAPLPVEPPTCPPNQRCRLDACGGSPVAALEGLGDDDVVVWFSNFSAAALDFARERQPLDELPTAGGLPGSCPAGEGVRQTLIPAPGGRAIAASIASGPDVDERTEAEALAIVNSIAHQPPQVHEQIPGVSVAQPGGWLRENGILSGGPGGTVNPWPSFAFGSYPLLRNPPDTGCDQLPVASLERLGRRDGIVWVVEPPAGSRPSEGMDDVVEVPGPVAEGTEAANCFRREGNFRLDGAWVERDGRVLLVGAATGLLADDARLVEVEAMVDSIVNGVGVEPAVTVDPPDGWEAAGQLTTQSTDETDLQVLAAGTFALRPDTEDVDCDHWPVQAANAMAPDDALVWLVQSQDPEPNLGAVPPFERYVDLDDWGRVRTCPAVDGEARYTEFQVGGRAYVAYVLLGDAVRGVLRREALAVVNALTFP